MCRPSHLKPPVSIPKVLAQRNIDMMPNAATVLHPDGILTAGLSSLHKNKFDL